MNFCIKKIIYQIANEKNSIISKINKVTSASKNTQHQQQFQLLNVKLKNNLDYYKKFLSYPVKTHSYCAQFSRTIILSSLSKQQKSQAYREIKNSLKNKKKSLTTQSATTITQNLCFFQFQGDQLAIINQIGDYFQQNNQFFDEKSKRRFQMAYQDIMINKAFGPVKFRPLQFKTSLTQTERKEKQLQKIYKQVDKMCFLTTHNGFIQINLSDLHLKILSYSDKLGKNQKDELVIKIKTYEKVKNIVMIQSSSLADQRINKNQIKNDKSILQQLKQRLDDYQSVKILNYSKSQLIQYCSDNYKLKNLQQTYAYLTVLNFHQYFQYLSFHKDKYIVLKKPIQLNRQEDTKLTYKYMNHQLQLKQLFKRNLKKIDKRVQSGVILVHQQDLEYFNDYIKRLIKATKQNKIQTKLQTEPDQAIKSKNNLLKVLFQYNQEEAKYWKMMSPL